MRWQASTRCLPHKPNNILSRKALSSSPILRGLQPVQKLPDWDLDRFRQDAFTPKAPARLPPNQGLLSKAQEEWFRHDVNTPQQGLSPGWSLNHDFWAQYQDTIVPLELSATGENGASIFERMQAPLGIFLDWTRQATDISRQRLYLAQCQLSDLPQTLRDQLPIPEIVLKAGRGDVYDSNIWMGLAPTYTPLHRDPNPNLFLQLAGRKTVILFPPDVGAAIFEDVQEKLCRSSSSIFRGDEMMQGEEKELLEREVWGGGEEEEEEEEEEASSAGAGYEANLDHGEALFIPLGWWHSIKGTGKGITASVNWWFR